MKFAVFFNYKAPEELEASMKMYDAVTPERERFPDKFPKQLTPTYVLLGDLPELKEKIRGFVTYEADSQEQMEDFWVFATSKLAELGVKEGIKSFIPIVESATTVPKLKALRK